MIHNAIKIRWPGLNDEQPISRKPRMRRTDGSRGFLRQGLHRFCDLRRDKTRRIKPYRGLKSTATISSSLREFGNLAGVRLKH